MTADEFWRCVRDGVIPSRGAAPTPVGEPIPAEIVHLLITRVHLSEVEVRALSKADAVARLMRFYTDGA